MPLIFNDKLSFLIDKKVKKQKYLYLIKDRLSLIIFEDRFSGSYAFIVRGNLILKF